MSDMHEPDSRFVERLGWQLSTEYRRADRFKSPSGKIAVPRTVVALTLVAGILMTGVATIKAADYFKDSWRKKIEIARAETDVYLNETHLASISEMASRAETQYTNGLIQEEEYRMVRFAAERAELILRRSLVNLDEVQISGAAPRDELYAPVVGGRDFVSERLQIEKEEAELGLDPLRSREARFAQLLEKGLASGRELQDIQTVIGDRKKIIDEIIDQLELRKRYIAGEITAKEVEIKGRIAEAESSLHHAESKVSFMQAELNRMEALEVQGLISPTEIMQLQAVLSAAQAELKLAALEKDILESIKY